jgi:hypothetical protein
MAGRRHLQLQRQLRVLLGCGHSGWRHGRSGWKRCRWCRMGRRCGSASAVCGIVSPRPGGLSGLRQPGGVDARSAATTTSWKPNRVIGGGSFGISVRAEGSISVGPGDPWQHCSRGSPARALASRPPRTIAEPGLSTGSLPDCVTAEPVQPHETQQGPAGQDNLSNRHGLRPGLSGVLGIATFSTATHPQCGSSALHLEHAENGLLECNL